MNIAITRSHAAHQALAPSAGRWTIDPGHAQVSFVGRHFGLTKVRGRFDRVSGEVIVGDDPSDSSVVVHIDTTSISAGDQARDDHLKSADFFDVERYPTATFESSALVVGGASATMTGVLTIKDVSHRVTLDVEYVGATVDTTGNERAVFAATGTINREDWGLTWNMLLDAGGLLVSKEIRLEIDVELVRQP
jgi:polyisoprenoid-binding protein YceI